MTYYHEARSEVVTALNSNQRHGLTQQQVEERLASCGENKLREKKKKTNFQRFLDQFKDAMILILLAAAAVSFAIACVEGETKEFF